MSKVTRNDLQKVLKKYHTKNDEAIKNMDNKIDNIPISSNPNLLINGDFQIWQRGNSITTKKSKQYSADRWCCWHTEMQITKRSNTSPAPVKNSLEIINVSTSEQKLYFYQPLEDYETYEGKTITSSFYIRGVNGFTGMFAYTIGSTSGHLINITSEWQKVETTQVVTFANAEQLYNKSVFFFGVNANMFKQYQGIEIAAVKIELGEKSTPFFPRSYTEEFLDCQRYYQIKQSLSVYCQCITETSANILLDFYVRMRTVPTITIDLINNELKFNFYGKRTTSSTNYTISSPIATTQRYLAVLNGFSGLTTGITYYLENPIQLDAEIY